MSVYGAVYGSVGSGLYADPGDVRLGVDRGDGILGTLIVGFYAPAPVDNLYLQAMNAGHWDTEKTLGETWVFESVEYPAIFIDPLTASDKATLGGRLREATVQICMREAIYETSGVGDGSIVYAREEKLRVMDVTSDGDGSRILICGPCSIEIPRR